MLIYQLPISLYSFKLRLALRLKGIEIEMREPPGGGYRSDAYRAINPAGTIPALVDGPGLLTETDAIIEYCDDLGLGRTLRSADPWLAAQHRMLSRRCDFSLEPAVRRLFPMIGAARDEDAIAEADSAIGRQLALIDAMLPPHASHALAEEPGLADCGLTAVMAWLVPLRLALRLRSGPGTRAIRTAEALGAHPLTSAECVDYQRLIATWIASKG